MVDDQSWGLEVLRSEIGWLEQLLDEDEDWRALGQLQAREARGEDLSSIHGAAIKAALVASLGHSRVFVRHQFLVAELVRAEQERVGGMAEAPSLSTVSPGNLDASDLCRINGITQALKRRLSALNISTFDQIAQWQTDDAQYVARTLGLGDRIETEDWIAQAARLVAERSVPDKSVPIAEDAATAASQLFNAGVPLPLPAWKYGRTTRPPLSITEAMAILGLTASLTDQADQPAPVIAVPRVAEAAMPAIENAGTAAITVTSNVAPAMPLPASAYVVPCVESSPEYSEPPPKPWPAQRYWSADMIGTAHYEYDPALPLPASAYAGPLVAAVVSGAEHVSLIAEPSNETLKPAPLAALTAPADRSQEIVAALPPNPVKVSPLEALSLQRPPPIAEAATGTRASETDTLRWAVDMVRETTAIESMFARSLADQPPGLPVLPAGPQAHVTIRRAEDAISNAVRYAPRATDIPAGQDFDAVNYAAYRGQVEEASVEIVRAGTPPPQPAESPPPPQIKPSGADRFRAPAPSPIGRLLKTLTGQ